ncbi:MAG: P1 family peptidase [Hyphomicrobiales bacterium]
MDGLTPGPRNLITDVEGISVGNAHDLRILTGTTIIVPDGPMVVAADIRGGAPGSRETPALEPDNLVDAFHAIVLSGGSVFGLDAASAVTAELARRGVGFAFGQQAWPCPVVPAAILFDLMNGGDKAWGDEAPYHRLGREAFAALSKDFALGNAGAGAGAIAGQIKGGLGSASAHWNGYTVGALVAVNSVGSCVRPESARLWAADIAIADEMGPQARAAGLPPCPRFSGTKLELMAGAGQPGANTTIAVVATDARLGKPEAKRLAIMAADGLAQAIRPMHTPFDGDMVFAAATGRKVLAEPRALTLARLGALAASTLARAVGRAVWAAQSAGIAPCYRVLAGL